MSIAMPPSAPGSATSRAAARAMIGRVEAQREQVYQAILAAGVDGLTRAEAKAATGLDGDSLRPRVWELLGHDPLVQPARIEVSDEIRRSPSGRALEVLVAISVRRAAEVPRG